MSKKTAKSKIDWYVVSKVREIRTGRGITQEDVAVYLDLSIGFIGHIESPKFRAKYNLAHLNELAKLFGCTLQEFFPEKPI